MSAKKSAEINTGFPIYGIKFINNKTVLAVGGGGEGNNGIPNKITAVRCSFNVKDKNRKIQKFREITLPNNEDSPMCIETGRTSSDEGRYCIFVGCNQSTQLIKSMNMNNNLRKYAFTDEEHLRFVDAVQFEDTVPIEYVGEYPKIISLSPESEVGAMMTSKVPSEILAFNPESLELVSRVRPSVPSEVKDFQVSPYDAGKTLALTTSSLVETVDISSGNVISSSSKADKKTVSTLGKYFLSKVRYVSENRLVLTGAFKSGKGSAILEYDTKTNKIVKESTVSKKMKGIVAIDYSPVQGLIAVAGNDFTITLIRQSDFKIITTISKLHKFAITSLSFSPNGKKLATGSASNTLNVLPIPTNYARGTSFFSFIFQFFILSILVGVVGFFLQQAHERGELAQYIDLGKKHGDIAYKQAQEYGKVAWELSQKYGSEYFDKAQVYGRLGYQIAREKSAFGIDYLKEKLNRENYEETDDTKQYFTMSDWTETASPSGTFTPTTAPEGETLRDIVSEVTKDIETPVSNTESLISEAKTHQIISSEPEATTTASPVVLLVSEEVKGQNTTQSDTNALVDLGIAKETSIYEPVSNTTEIVPESVTQVIDRDASLQALNETTQISSLATETTLEEKENKNTAFSQAPIESVSAAVEASKNGTISSSLVKTPGTSSQTLSILSSGSLNATLPFTSASSVENGHSVELSTVESLSVDETTHTENANLDSLSTSVSLTPLAQLSKTSIAEAEPMSLHDEAVAHSQTTDSLNPSTLEITNGESSIPKAETSPVSSDETTRATEYLGTSSEIAKAPESSISLEASEPKTTESTVSETGKGSVPVSESLNNPTGTSISSEAPSESLKAAEQATGSTTSGVNKPLSIVTEALNQASKAAENPISVATEALNEASKLTEKEPVSVATEALNQASKIAEKPVSVVTEALNEAAKEPVSAATEALNQASKIAEKEPVSVVTEALNEATKLTQIPEEHTSAKLEKESETTQPSSSFSTEQTAVTLIPTAESAKPEVHDEL